MQILNTPSHLEHVSSIFTNVCNGILYKCAFSFLYILYAFSFDTLKLESLLALTALVAFDFVTGVIGAKVAGERLHSKGIFRTAVKWLVYLLMISAAHLVEGIVPQINSFVDEAMFAFLALTELVSILENIGKMGYQVPQKLLNKLVDLKDSK